MASLCSLAIPLWPSGRVSSSLIVSRPLLEDQTLGRPWYQHQTTAFEQEAWRKMAKAAFGEHGRFPILIVSVLISSLSRWPQSTRALLYLCLSSRL